jgi:hypothetical protein
LYLSPPKDINMRFPDQVLACVGFFSRDRADDGCIGTGFIVRIPGAHGNSFLHLVTAKHLVDGFKGPWILRMNDRSGGKIALKSGGVQKWWPHPTDEAHVDCAVTLFAPSMLDEYNFSWINLRDFADAEKIQKAGIGVGDEVNVLGLFSGFHGSQTHTPILRSGNIAMMPSDPVPVKGFGEMRAYIVDTTVTSGLSGSPVFVRETLHLQGQLNRTEESVLVAPGRIYFLGLLHGHWKVDAATAEQIGGANSGISIVVPATKILETLNHPELVQMRQEIDDQIAKEKLPVMDVSEHPEDDRPFTKADFEEALRKVSRKIAPQEK